MHSLAVRLGDWVLTLTDTHGHPTAQIAHEVHGVTLSRRHVTLDIWVEKPAEWLRYRPRSASRAYSSTSG